MSDVERKFIDVKSCDRKTLGVMCITSRQAGRPERVCENSKRTGTHPNARCARVLLTIAERQYLINVGCRAHCAIVPRLYRVLGCATYAARVDITGEVSLCRIPNRRFFFT